RDGFVIPRNDAIFVAPPCEECSATTNSQNKAADGDEISARWICVSSVEENLRYYLIQKIKILNIN
ncbi:43396_t:CDS:1, partial [Gigaspora margarita]